MNKFANYHVLHFLKKLPKRLVKMLVEKKGCHKSFKFFCYACMKLQKNSFSFFLFTSIILSTMLTKNLLTAIASHGLNIILAKHRESPLLARGSHMFN